MFASDRGCHALPFLAMGAEVPSGSGEKVAPDSIPTISAADMRRHPISTVSQPSG